MTSNVAVSLYAIATILFSFGSFLAILGADRGSESFESAVIAIVLGGLSWALGSVLGYFVPKIRSITPAATFARMGLTILFAAVAAAWPWVGPGALGLVSIVVAFISMGALMPALIILKAEEPEELRNAFAKALIGSALGAALSAAIWSAAGVGSLFLVASAAALLAPIFEGHLFFNGSAARRWAFVPMVLGVLGLSFTAPSKWTRPEEAPATAVSLPFALEAVFQFRKDKKFDTFVLGQRAISRYAQLPVEALQSGMKSLTVVNSDFDDEDSASLPSDIELTSLGGSGRRRLAGESRRFDLIQILAPTSGLERSGTVMEESFETRLTVEAFRLYFDRLKDDGFLQIVGALQGPKGQATLATMAEAWKKSARPDIDLHAVAVSDETGTTIQSVILRMKPFTREERDRLGEILKVGSKTEPTAWMLVSDASGMVLSDDHPFIDPIFQMGSLESSSKLIFWFAIVFVVGLIVWIAMQERRKGLASRWQTASVATYFAGLGLSFAFFQTYFVLRAAREWGMPVIAVALVLSALFVARAAGATLVAGHPRRRFGVRIQPLVTFVFGVLLTYLGTTLFEPLVATGSEWISAFVGMSLLIPFGLLGGAFLPNALEEASEKLAPRVLSLLWALYIAGTSLGIFGAMALGFESGLDVVFLAGLFCFAWIAIFSGLVRPWNVRKSGTPIS